MEKTKEMIIVQSKLSGEYIKIRCGHCGHLLKVGRYMVVRAEAEDKFVVKDEEPVFCEHCENEQIVPALYEVEQDARSVQLDILMFGAPKERFMPLLNEAHVVH